MGDSNDKPASGVDLETQDPRNVVSSTAPQLQVQPGSSLPAIARETSLSTLPATKRRARPIVLVAVGAATAPDHPSTPNVPTQIAGSTMQPIPGAPVSVTVALT